MVEKLNADQIRTLLRSVGEQLQAVGETAELYIAGGAAITLCYDQEYSTADVDGVYEPRGPVEEAVKTVAAEVEYDIKEYWLNDAINRYMVRPELDENARAIMGDCPALDITVASPERLIGMKCAAGRSKDVSGIKKLCEAADVTDVDEIVKIATKHAQLENHLGRSAERVRAFANDIVGSGSARAARQ